MRYDFSILQRAEDRWREDLEAATRHRLAQGLRETGLAKKLRQKGGRTMKLALRYVRYALATLSTVAFKLATN